MNEVGTFQSASANQTAAAKESEKGSRSWNIADLKLRL